MLYSPQELLINAFTHDTGYRMCDLSHQYTQRAQTMPLHMNAMHNSAQIGIPTGRALTHDIGIRDTGYRIHERL
jgi:hypothetical protein